MRCLKYSFYSICQVVIFLFYPYYHIYSFFSYICFERNFSFVYLLDFKKKENKNGNRRIDNWEESITDAIYVVPVLKRI